MPAELVVAAAALLDDDEEDDEEPQALTATARAEASEARTVKRIRLGIGSLLRMCEYARAARATG